MGDQRQGGRRFGHLCQVGETAGLALGDRPVRKTGVPGFSLNMGEEARVVQGRLLEFMVGFLSSLHV